MSSFWNNLPHRIIAAQDREIAALKKQLLATEIERDRYKAELERLRANLGSICPEPACSTNNPRT